MVCSVIVFSLKVEQRSLPSKIDYDRDFTVAIISEYLYIVHFLDALVPNFTVKDTPFASVIFEM